MGTIHHYTERGPYVQQKMKRRNIPRFRALGIDRAVENAELQDKLDKAQNELRRAQAELRLNQSDYERSQVDTKYQHYLHYLNYKHKHIYVYLYYLTSSIQAYLYM